MDTYGKCIDCGEKVPKNRTKYCCNICKNRMKSYNSSIRKRMKRCDISTKNREKKWESRWKNHDNISLRRLYKRDKGHCYICDSILPKPEKGYDKNSDNAPQVDHYIPLAKCGEHSWSNVYLICKKCNSEKGDKLLPSKWIIINYWQNVIRNYCCKRKNRLYLLSFPTSTVGLRASAYIKYRVRTWSYFIK